MSVHKLSNGPLVISVVGAQVVEGNFGMQVEFFGVDLSTDYEVKVYVNQDTAIRQLERLGLDMNTVVGRSLHIEQVKKDGRTYTNFRNATAGEVQGQGAAPSAPASAPAHAPAAPRAQVDVSKEYRGCLQDAVECADFLSEAGFPCDATNVIAMAATLFIQKSKAR